MNLSPEILQDVHNILESLKGMIKSDQSLESMKPLIQELKSKGQLNYRELAFAGQTTILESCSTLLNYAVAKQKVDLVWYLLNEGADPTIQNNFYCDTLTYIMDHYMKGRWAAEQRENFDLVDYIITIYPSTLKNQVMGYGALGNTPLHRVARYQRLPLFIFLLSKGADLHFKNFSSQTPFDLLKESYNSHGEACPSEKDLKEMVADEELSHLQEATEVPRWLKLKSFK